MFARSAALAWPSALRAIAFHSLSMGATASCVIWMARSACCTARLGSGRGSSVRIRVYSRARGFGRRESPVRSPTASAVTLACTSRSSTATTGSRSAAGIRVNTFVRRARSGSSANSPSRRDADSSSVRTVSSGRASCWPGGRAIAIRASTIDGLCAMGLPVFVGSAFVAQYPTGGGNFWVPLQYLLGLRALGVEAHWLELLWARGDRRRAAEFVRAFRSAVARLGVAEWVTLVCFPEGSRDDPPGQAEHHGLAPPEPRGRAPDALLLDPANSVAAPLRTGFARTALLDVDPGPFQLWAREHRLGVGEHDVHLTIGQNLGATDSPVPLGAVAWEKVWPAVHLPAWPDQGGAGGTCYTTGTQGGTQQYAFLRGETYDCNKRPGVLALLDLPGPVPVARQLAAHLHRQGTEDRTL